MAWPVSSAAAYFNPRTPVGCDTGVERILFEHGEFQSTHPSGVRRGSQGAVIQYWDISIHAPQWGATTSSALLTSGEQFQSTHPSGVRRVKPVRSISHTPYFNPRTPVGCDTPNDAAHTVIVQFQSTHLYELAGRHAHPRAHGHRPISIHAPQWGATGNHAIHFRVDGISIHAPQWGATIDGVLPLIDRMISIHAPQWGATRTCCESERYGLFQSTHPSGVRLVFGASARTSVIFQSTHPSGVRPNMLRLGNAVRVFQSTHPSGVRQWNCKTIYKTRDFNPRTPVGCDLVPRMRCGCVNRISIHAPQWGATVSPQAARPLTPNFNPRTAPQWGATIIPCGHGVANVISIHAPQWGATALFATLLFQQEYFNPRTPVGCDGLGYGTYTVTETFQSTHPSGVRPI